MPHEVICGNCGALIERKMKKLAHILEGHNKVKNGNSIKCDYCGVELSTDTFDLEITSVKVNPRS